MVWMHASYLLHEPCHGGLVPMQTRQSPPPKDSLIKLVNEGNSPALSLFVKQIMKVGAYGGGAPARAVPRSQSGRAR